MLSQPSSQENFLYKSNVVNFLKERGLVDSRFFASPLSGTKHMPDLVLSHKGNTSACELKISPNVFGQLELLYSDTVSRNPWKFKPIRLVEDEKYFMKDVASSADVDIFKRIKRAWKNEAPMKRDIKDRLKDVALKQILKRIPFSDLFKLEKKKFEDIEGVIQPSRIETYYNNRNVYYINFGTHGLFRLGEKNPLNLRNVPLFREHAKVHFLITMKKRPNKNDYDFLFLLDFEMFIISAFNIGPVHGGRSITILRDRVNLDCFQ
jgi:hypothetical protein